MCLDLIAPGWLSVGTSSPQTSRWHLLPLSLPPVQWCPWGEVRIPKGTFTIHHYLSLHLDCMPHNRHWSLSALPARAAGIFSQERFSDPQRTCVFPTPVAYVAGCNFEYRWIELSIMRQSKALQSPVGTCHECKSQGDVTWFDPRKICPTKHSSKS